MGDVLQAAIERIKGGLMRPGQLSNRTWRMYRLSPLHQLSPHNKEALLLYADQLKQVLLERYPLPPNRMYVCTCYMTGNRTRSDGRPVSMLVFAVGVVDEQSKGDADVESITRVCLISDLVENIKMAPIEEDSFSYPIGFGRGSTMILDLLLEWLEKYFDCRCAPLTLAPYQLIQLFHPYILTPDGSMNPEFGAIDRCTKSLDLFYRFPESCPSMKSVKVTLDSHALRSLAKALSVYRGDYLLVQNGTCPLLGAIEAHIYTTTRIHLAHATIFKVSTEWIALQCDGRIKFTFDPIPDFLFALNHLLIKS